MLWFLCFLDCGLYQAIYLKITEKLCTQFILGKQTFIDFIYYTR